MLCELGWDEANLSKEQQQKKLLLQFIFYAFYSFTASTANMIGENQGLDAIYELLPRYTTKHLHVLK